MPVVKRIWSWLMLDDLIDEDAPVPSIREVIAYKVMRDELRHSKRICEDRRRFNSRIAENDFSLAKTIGEMNTIDTTHIK